MGAVAIFFALTFILAWSLWLAAAVLVPPDSVPAGLRALSFLPGTLAPGIAALLLTLHHSGGGGVRALVGRLAILPAGARWYLFAFGFMAGVKLAAALAYRLLEDAWPTFGTVPVYVLPLAVLLSTPFQAGEEIGWRGYALPRLAAGMGTGPASVLLGVVWASWHIPLFYIAGTDTTGQPFPIYLLSVTAVSVAMAWLYAGTRGSLLLAMLMHAAINNTTGIVPGSVAQAGNPLTWNSTLIGWLTAGILWACAAFFLLRLRGHRFQESQPSRVAACPG
jgi:uncharacterized protein